MVNPPARAYPAPSPAGTALPDTLLHEQMERLAPDPPPKAGAEAHPSGGTAAGTRRGRCVRVPPPSLAARPDGAGCGASFDGFAYVATTLLHVRPLHPLQIDLLRCCPTPRSLLALAAQMNCSPATVVWLLVPLLQHGLVKPLALPLSPAEENGGTR